MDEDEHVVIDSPPPAVGMKRCSAHLDDSSQKISRTASPPPPSSIFGFQSSTVSPNGISSGVPSAFRDFASRPAFGTISSTCPAVTSSCPSLGTTSTATHTSLSATATLEPATSQEPITHASFLDGGPIPHDSFLHGDGPSLRCDALSHAYWTEITQAALHRMNTGPSHHQSLMSERASSTVVPSPLNDFNKGLGSCFYVPPTVIRHRDDGQDPAHARALVDSLAPPLLVADAAQKGVQELAHIYDLHAFNSFMSGSFMRQGFVRECKRLSELIQRLKGELDTRNSDLSKLGEELEKVKKTSSSLRKDIEGLEVEHASLKTNIEALVKEKEDSNEKISKLESELIFMDAALKNKQAELDAFKSSSRDEIDGLKAELETERKLKADLATQVATKEAEFEAFMSLEAAGFVFPSNLNAWFYDFAETCVFGKESPGDLDSPEVADWSDSESVESGDWHVRSLVD